MAKYLQSATWISVGSECVNHISCTLGFRFWRSRLWQSPMMLEFKKENVRKEQGPNCERNMPPS